MIQLENLRVHDDAEALARETAAWLCGKAAAAPERFAICLSGGRTPRRLYELLASTPLLERFPWARTHWFWADERFVPADHPDSNYRMVREAMLERTPAPAGQVHAIATAGFSPAQAAKTYERDLKAFYGLDSLEEGRPLFDVTLLGLGADGHTASLFPGSPVLEDTAAWAAGVIGARPEPRITLTYPVLEASRDVVFLVSGAEKQEILAAIARGEDFPASRLRPKGRLHWFVERAAIGAAGSPARDS